MVKSTQRMFTESVAALNLASGAENTLFDAIPSPGSQTTDSGVLVGGVFNCGVVALAGQTGRGFVRFVALRLKSGVAVPAITAGSLQTESAGADVWWDVSMPITGGVAAMVPWVIKSKRRFESGERLVIVVRYVGTNALLAEFGVVGDYFWHDD